ncbi:MAG: adenylate/guanylate cyclase domain-containing protein, partial [Myxococcales bacterium]
LVLEELRAITTPLGAPLAVGIGLHLGEVLYGNVGARDRLDFTVIGRAVNEVTRVERLCRELSVPLLMSGSFARGVGDEPRLASVGTQALRGVSQPHELFTLAHLLP